MHRSLLAAVGLLYLGVGIAQGDYVIVKVSLAFADAQPVDPKGEEQTPTTYLPAISSGFMRPGQRRPTIPAFGGLGQVGDSLGGPLTAAVFLEYSAYQRVSVNPTRTLIKHRWAVSKGSFILDDGKTIRTSGPYSKPTVFSHFDGELKRLKTPKEKSAQGYYDLAQFAVSNGLVDQVDEVMAELAKLTPKEGRIAAALKAHQKVKNDLAKPPGLDDLAISWSKLLECKIDRSEHYCMLYDSTNAGAPEEAKARLARLEHNLKAFYYWFALEGRALPLPERRLVAVLVEKPPTFRALHQASGAPPWVADGFFARRDNLLVLSLNRLDHACEPLYRHFTELIQKGWNLKSCLDIKTFQSSIPKNELGLTLEEAARVQTMALVKRALDDESEIATASHQGTRQILAAIDMLPRGVALPEWVQYGLPSVFETPKYDPVLQTGAFWPTMGAPHWTHLVQFQVWDSFKELEPPGEAIMDVLTDAFFREARDTGNADALAKGRTMSWALSYYLVQRHLDKLLRYTKELSLLPRDLEFDGNVHLGCFARAFDLADPAKPNGIDADKLEKLAEEWYKFIQLTPVQIPAVKEEAKRIHGERRKAKRQLP